MPSPFEPLKTFLRRELSRLDASRPRLLERQAYDRGKRTVLLKLQQLIEESEEREAKREAHQSAAKKRLLRQIESKL